MKSAKVQFEGVIQPWGNSLGLRITKPMGKLAHLGRGDTVIIDITEEGLLVRPKTVKPKQLPFTEDELLVGLTPHTAHANGIPALIDSEIEE